MGQVFQKALFIKKGLYIFFKEAELEKFLLGKTQNANKSFNSTIWERIPKNTFVTLPTLELVYMTVQHTAILE